MKRKPKTIDGYLSTVAGEKRVALERLRITIRELVPRALECISYGIPAFRLNEAVIAGFATTTKGCSYFPFSGSTLETLGTALEGFETTKSSLHFGPDKPLSKALVRKLLRARVAETKERQR